MNILFVNNFCVEYMVSEIQRVSVFGHILLLSPIFSPLYLTIIHLL